MLKFFRSKLLVRGNPLKEKAAGWLVVKILWLQNKWVLCMDRGVNRLSVRSKKFGLMLFVGLSVLTCVSIVIETFSDQTESSSLKIGNIKKGRYVVTTGAERISSHIPAQQYKRVSAFHLYMDSLSVSTSGRKIFDSINHYRPGLLDSAIQLEKLYQSQNK
jgi:hypothetical protein